MVMTGQHSLSFYWCNILPYKKYEEVHKNIDTLKLNINQSVTHRSFLKSAVANILNSKIQPMKVNRTEMMFQLNPGARDK